MKSRERGPQTRPEEAEGQQTDGYLSRYTSVTGETIAAAKQDATRFIEESVSGLRDYANLLVDSDYGVMGTRDANILRGEAKESEDTLNCAEKSGNWLPVAEMLIDYAMVMHEGSFGRQPKAEKLTKRNKTRQLYVLALSLGAADHTIEKKLTF